MIVVITGVPGVGKTTISKEVASRLDWEYIDLNTMAQSYTVAYVDTMQTFDVDTDKLFEDLEVYLEGKKNIIVDGHFAHGLSCKYVHMVIVINRDLKQLKNEYKSRGYPEQKIKDNLESEIFDICYQESCEYGHLIVHQVNNNADVEDAINTIVDILRKE